MIRADFIKQYRIDILILFTVLTAVFFLCGKGLSTDYFKYDEADYMYAASKGLYANYIDKNAIPFSTFIRQGLNKGLKKAERTSLSEFLRGSDDISFYRHYHGPLYFYVLSLSNRILGESEFLSRWTSLLFWITSVAACYMGCLFLLGKESRMSAILASAFMLFSTTNIQTSSQITPHGLYVLTVIISLFLISKFLKTEKLKFFYFAIIAMAFAFLAIEYALLILFTLISCVWVQRRVLFSGWAPKDFLVRAVIVPAALFFGTIFVIWPAAWLKLSLVRNYIFFAYFAVVRGSEYGTQAFWEVWINRFVHSPVEYILLIPATALAMLRVKERKWYLPFLIYPFLVFICTFRNTSTSPTYISSLLPPLFILSGIVISDLLGKFSQPKRKVICTIIVLVLFGSFYFRFFLPMSRELPKQKLKYVVNYIQKNRLHDGNTLVDRDFLPTLHYYFPAKLFPSYRKSNETFQSITEKIRNNSYDDILFCAEEDRFAFERSLKEFFVFDRKIITNYDNKDIVHYKMRFSE
jgi:hypothetical protein